MGTSLPLPWSYGFEPWSVALESIAQEAYITVSKNLLRYVLYHICFDCWCDSLEILYLYIEGWWSIEPSTFHFFIFAECVSKITSRDMLVNVDVWSLWKALVKNYKIATWAGERKCSFFEKSIVSFAKIALMVGECLSKCLELGLTLLLCWVRLSKKTRRRFHGWGSERRKWWTTSNCL